MHGNVVFTWIFTLALAGSSLAGERALHFGVSSIEITPDFPIRLSGYASRTNETSTVAERIHAKGLAIQEKGGPPALMLTMDNCGNTKEFRDELLSRLKHNQGITSERLVLFSTHTHTAPCLSNSLDNLFIGPLPADQQKRVDRYTRELLDKVELVAYSALKVLQPGKVYWAEGKATFAKNRRTEGGPVDHRLPVLIFKNAQDEIRAVVANYACHCTTMGDLNQIHGDWAGLAGTYLEQEHEKLTALITIGCGADANPHPRGQMQHAEKYGREIATEVTRLLKGSTQELTGPLRFNEKAIELPFDPLPTREQWMERAKQAGIIGYHAKKNLERLNRGETLPTTLPYLVQTWSFGDDLATVFLPGEVVVDYALRLRREFDGAKLWISAYANWVPCYIPSERILREGGYEAESSLWYYDRPARLSPKTENLIIETVREIMPPAFHRKEKGKPAELPSARPLQESAESLQGRAH